MQIDCILNKSRKLLQQLHGYETHPKNSQNHMKSMHVGTTPMN